MDILTPEARAKRMSLIRNKNTKPELLVRRLVHGMGFRYRLHDKKLPGCPDLVFRRRKKVIFVHGCFWHRHDDPKCTKGRLPKSRQDFWEPKLNANRDRDRLVEETLKQAGWEVMIVWECQCRRIEELRAALYDFIAGPSHAENPGA